MRIVLATAFRDSPSTVLNLALLNKLSANFELNGDVALADIILFMCYDPKIDEARARNPKAKIGIIDPRPGSEDALMKADFFLANGVEMVNTFVKFQPNYFIYPIYPPLQIPKHTTAESTDAIRIGYHGNKVHLELMESTVGLALNRVSNSTGIELICVYNIQDLGLWKREKINDSIKVRHVQWSNSAYDELASCDIGIIPNLIPFNPTLSSYDIDLQQRSLAHTSDQFFRLKPTSNMGRILVFAQLNVPVIADMFPSAASIIDHSYNGLLATDSDSWYEHLRFMIRRERERKLMGARMLETFNSRYHSERMNNELISFFTQMMTTCSMKYNGIGK